MKTPWSSLHQRGAGSLSVVVAHRSQNSTVALVLVRKITPVLKTAPWRLPVRVGGLPLGFEWGSG